VMEFARGGHLAGPRLGSLQWTSRDGSTASVLVAVHRVPRIAPAEAWRLLRLLFLRLGAMPADPGSGLTHPCSYCDRKKRVG
jgi:hypothetical protein